MTEGTGLKLRREEWDALALKWDRLSDEDRTMFRSQMTRAQERRFDRILETHVAGKRNYANQMTTRGEVVQMLALYIDRNLMPVAQNVDRLEARVAFLELPFYRRWWLGLVAWAVIAWEWLERFLDKRGIHLIDLGGSREDRTDAGAGDAGEEQGAAAGAAGPAAETAASEPGLHGGERLDRERDGDRGHGDGDGDDGDRAAARAGDRGRPEEGGEEARGEEEARRQEKGARQEEEGLIRVVSR